MDSESLSFLIDQKADLENVPPAENLAKVSQNSPAFSKLDLLSSVASQGVTMSKLGGERINFTCFHSQNEKASVWLLWNHLHMLLSSKVSCGFTLAFLCVCV